MIVFFVISGFLITASLDRNRTNIRRYLVNRVLRIVPALYIAFIMTFMALSYFGFINGETLKNLPFWGWVIGQLTLFQFYTPDVLRPYGVSCPNGSLWTIPVEFVFYLCLPVIIWLFRKRKIIGLSLFFLLSVACNAVLAKIGSDGLISKLIEVSVLPYLYIFLLGSLLYYTWDKIHGIFEGKAYIFMIIYVLYVNLFDGPSYYITSVTVFIANILLCLLTISLAYTLPKIGKILHGFDLSYGLYVYHMVVVNIFVQSGFVGNVKYAIYALTISICLGMLSWWFVERKALQLKSRIS